MISLNRVRLKVLRAISKLWMSDPSDWQIDRKWPIQWPALDTSQMEHIWSNRRPKTLRLWYRILIGALILLGLYSWTSDQEVQVTQSFQPRVAPYYNSTTHLRHIPPKIWQIYLDFSPDQMLSYMDHIYSWISNSPSYDYTILDKAGALAIMSDLLADPAHARILPLYYAMSRRVMRADFLRYLLLATEGGIYSDIDTHLVQPIDNWVPAEFKAATRLIVGLEADQDPPVHGTTYPVQFCQWTLAAAPGHPAMWKMVDSILEDVESRPYQTPPRNVEYSDEEVLNITGPAAWTPVVFDFLSEAAGARVDWRNLTGMRSPRLYGDILVLPINSFTSGVPHSGSVAGSPDALIRHSFGGSWRGGTSQ